MFRHLRALFYGKNPDAARTKRSTVGKKSSTLIEGTVSRVGTAPQFPDTGWTSDPSSFPKVSFTTILSHLVSSGKAMERSGDGSSSTSVVLTMRPLERANDFFLEATSTTSLSVIWGAVSLLSRSALPLKKKAQSIIKRLFLRKTSRLQRMLQLFQATSVQWCLPLVKVV